jgi:subtilisin-like proprotein convertase family protein
MPRLPQAGLLGNPTLNYSQDVGLPIPDNSPIGLARSMVLPSSPFAIRDVTLTLDITGGSNGDLYAYVVHDTGFAVLLNRPGRTASNPTGYLDPGMTVSFSDSAVLGDIHRYRETLGGAPSGGRLTGAWQPDGRDVDPGLSLDTEPRTATLQSFAGLAIGGTWTLFVADMDAGGEGTLDRWGLVITPVPELSTTATVAVALAAAWAIATRRRRRAQEA